MKTLLKFAFFALITLVGTNSMVCPAATSVKAPLVMPKNFAQETLARLVLIHDFLTNSIENKNVEKYFTTNKTALIAASTTLSNQLDAARVYAAKLGQCSLDNVCPEGIWEVFFTEAAEVAHQIMLAISQTLAKNSFDAATKAEFALNIAMIKPWDAELEMQDPLLNEVVDILLNEKIVMKLTKRELKTMVD